MLPQLMTDKTYVIIKAEVDVKSDIDCNMWIMDPFAQIESETMNKSGCNQQRLS